MCEKYRKTLVSCGDKKFLIPTSLDGKISNYKRIVDVLIDETDKELFEVFKLKDGVEYYTDKYKPLDNLIKK